MADKMMNFSEALISMNAGESVQRKDWIKEGFWLRKVDATPGVNGDQLMLFNRDGVVQDRAFDLATDALATDWSLVKTA